MAMFQLNMMGAFAQFERELIRQRQREGIEAAKAPRRLQEPAPRPGLRHHQGQWDRRG